MFCRNCGKEISDNSVFCTFCGFKIHEEGTFEESAEGIKEDKIENERETIEPIDRPQSPINAVLKSKKINKNVVIAIVCLIAIVIAFVVMVPSENYTSALGLTNDIADCYENAFFAIDIGSDTYYDWVELIDEYEEMYLYYYSQCNKREQKKLDEEYLRALESVSY